MWTDTTRPLYEREGLALPGDLTDAEWEILKPYLPPPAGTGRPRKWEMRRIVEAILYLLRGGLPWRMLPPNFPPVATVQRWFHHWRDSRLWLEINHALLMTVREAQGREASPSAGVIDSQSVKTTEAGGPRGYDAGRKIKGRKCHILTDTQGHLVHAVVHPANIQDRDGAPLVPADVTKRFPWLRHLFADGAYAGDKLQDALQHIGRSPWTLEIVKHPDNAEGFVLLPRRWVVERSFAWFSRNRRLSRAFEKSLSSSSAWLFPASIQLFLRRSTRLNLISFQFRVRLLPSTTKNK